MLGLAGCGRISTVSKAVLMQCQIKKQFAVKIGRPCRHHCC